jgi:hypothetical protein
MYRTDKTMMIITKYKLKYILNFQVDRKARKKCKDYLKPGGVQSFS